MVSTYSKKDLEKFRGLLNEKISGMVEATKELAGPLNTLNKNQIAAVTFLVLERGILMSASRKSAGLDEGLLLGFKDAVKSICPDLEPILELSRFKDPCMEHQMAYVSALAKCKEEGKDEDDCPEAWGPGAAAINCEMEKINDMQGLINKMWERLGGPKPTPWPVVSVKPRV